MDRGRLRVPRRGGHHAGGDERCGTQGQACPPPRGRLALPRPAGLTPIDSGAPQPYSSPLSIGPAARRSPADIQSPRNTSYQLDSAPSSPAPFRNSTTRSRNIRPTGITFLSRRQVNPESPKGSAGSSHVEERTTGGTPWQGESEEKRSKLELELDGSQRRSLPPCGIHGPGDPFERESTGRPQGRARRLFPLRKAPFGP